MLPCLFLKKLRRKTTHEYVIYITRHPRIQCSTKTAPPTKRISKRNSPNKASWGEEIALYAYESIIRRIMNKEASK